MKKTIFPIGPFVVSAKTTNIVNKEGKQIEQVFFVAPETTLKQILELYKENGLTGEIRIRGRGITYE